jgi:two-component system, OmpR family, osmolarity sensor histidine kinase EnvZ
MSSSPIEASEIGAEAPPEAVSGDRIVVRPGGWVKRALPRGMFGRALLIVIIPLIVVQLIATWFFYDRHWAAVSWRLSAGVVGDIALAIAAAEPTSSEAERAALLSQAAAATDLDFTLHPGDRLPTGDAVGGSLLEAQLRELMEQRVRRPYRLDIAGDPIGVTVQLPDGVLAVAVPRKRLSSPTTYIFFMWMVGSSLVLLGVAALFLRNQVKSLRRLAAAADGFGKGRPVPFFKVEGATEIRRAAVAFMTMRDRIERQIRQRTEMLAGVSHDLRTPLTRMKLALELLGADAAVDELKSDVAEMEHMVQGYLDFVRGEGAEAAVETDVALLLEDVAAAARRDGTPLKLASPPEYVMPLRPDAMRRCLVNLVGNARRYGSQVWLTGVALTDGIDILVDDDGPGIADADRERAFRPFVRLDTSRNPSTGGIGLGLAIARDVARSHGGDIRLENSPQGGLRARLHLPR